MMIHGRQLIEILPLRDLYTDYADHHRLIVFVNKGRECVTCDREGVFLLVCEEPKSGAQHVDLYTQDFVLMTVDHITPKKVARDLDWTIKQIESLDNKQTMCGPCNWNKSCKPVTNEQWAKVRSKVLSPRYSGIEAIWSLVNNENVFSQKLAF